jgi:hypothetical protein
LEILEEYALPWQPWSLWYRAQVHAVLRDRDAALLWLGRAVESGYRLPSRSGWSREFEWLAGDPAFEALERELEGG